MTKKNVKSGITLVEIIVLMVIVSILVPIMFYAQRKNREDARRASCVGRLKQIGLSWHIYSADWGGMLPATAGDIWDALELLYPNYCNTMTVFVCASDSKPASTNDQMTNDNLSYGYVVGLTEDDSSDTPVMLDEDEDALDGIGPVYDRNDNHGTNGANLLYLDTHVKWNVGPAFPDIGNIHWPH